MMMRFLSFILILMSLLSNAQVIDFLNPQLTGNVKSAHYIVYFDAGEDDFAKPYDGNIVNEYQYNFNKEGDLEAILEISDVGDAPFSLEFKNGKIKKFEQKLWNGNFLQKGTIIWNPNSYQVEIYNIFKHTVKQNFVLNSQNVIEELTEETSDKDGLFKIIQKKAIRDQGKIVKIVETESYPKSNSVKNCETVFSDLEHDSTRNLISYRTKNSCSATYEKHTIKIEYWE